MVRCLECSHAGVEYLRHILVLHLAEIFHCEYKALLVGQTAYGFVEEGIGPVAAKVCVALEPVGYLTIGAVYRHYFALVLAQECECFVHRYAVEPSGYLRFPTEFVDVAPRFEECVLQQVVGIVVRQHHTPYVPVERLAVLLYDSRKGGLAPVLVGKQGCYLLFVYAAVVAHLLLGGLCNLFLDCASGERFNVVAIFYTAERLLNFETFSLPAKFGAGENLLCLAKQRLLVLVSR